MSLPSLDTLGLYMRPDGLGIEAEAMADSRQGQAGGIEPGHLVNLSSCWALPPQRHASTFQAPSDRVPLNAELGGQPIYRGAGLVALHQAS